MRCAFKKFLIYNSGHLAPRIDLFNAADVTEAMLVVKNKSVSLHGEIISIYMQILWNKMLIKKYWLKTNYSTNSANKLQNSHLGTFLLAESIFPSIIK